MKEEVMQKDKDKIDYEVITYEIKDLFFIQRIIAFSFFFIMLHSIIYNFIQSLKMISDYNEDDDPCAEERSKAIQAANIEAVAPFIKTRLLARITVRILAKINADNTNKALAECRAKHGK